MMYLLLRLMVVAVILLWPVAGVADAPEYQAGAKTEGCIRTAGSDTLRILLEAWTKAYAKHQPGATAEIESLGSSTAPPALIDGSCDIAAMSRKMEPEEISQFEQKFGYKPTEIHVALDAVAVIVHPDNPVEGLTLKQLDGIFSSTRACGGRDITRWDQLFIGSAMRPEIKIYGRNNLSGTYAFFQDKALCGGAYKENIKELPDSDDIEAAVAEDPAGIGYSGLGYARVFNVKVLAIARNANSGYRKFYVEKFWNSTDLGKRYAWVYRGEYSLTRMLRLYVNKQPGKQAPPLVDDFLRFVLSREGQEIAVKTNYIPLKEKMIVDQRKKLAPDYKPSWWSF